MGKVRLEANPAGQTDHFQQIEHVFPRVHTTPADFTFHHQYFVKISSNLCTLLECLGDELGSFHRVLSPLLHTRGGVNADRAIFTHAMLTKDFAITACLTDSIDKASTRLSVTHRTASYSPLPNRSHKAANLQAHAGNFISQFADFRLIGINVEMRLEQEHVYPVKAFTSHFTGNRHLQHSIQADRRLV